MITFDRLVSAGNLVFDRLVDVAVAGSPVITGITTTQEGVALTITGTDFSSSGNLVYIGPTDQPDPSYLVTISTESTTQIVTVALGTVGIYLTRSNFLLVANVDGVLSNVIQITVLPTTGTAVYAITQDFLGDATTRFSSVPELEFGDEIRVQNVLGTNVTISNVHVTGQGAVDVVSDADTDPQVSSLDYSTFDGDQLSEWATVTWSTLAATTTVPNVIGLTQALAEAAISAATLISTVIASVPSLTQPAGIVLAQFPPATTVLNVDSVVELTISTGLPQVLVPDLTGLTLTEATAALLALGLVRGTVSIIFDLLGGLIVQNQTITPGTLVDVGSAVGLEITALEVAVGMSAFARRGFRGLLGLFTGRRTVAEEGVPSPPSLGGRGPLTLLMGLI